MGYWGHTHGRIFVGSFTFTHPELSGCITTLAVEVANFCAAMDTLIDQDDFHCELFFKG